VGLQAQRGWTRFRAAEMYYSLLGRDLEHEIVPFALDAGIGIMVWSPLAGGFLSGRYTREDPTGGRGRLRDFNVIPFDLERGYDLVERLRAIAAARGATPAQLALAWLLTRPAVASILVGASNARQLDGNLGVTALTFTADELAELDRLTAPPPLYPNWFYANIPDDPVRAVLEPR
jgi:aryl-alcohol dehydrogenase-like predicted oxidoreductase